MIRNPLLKVMIYPLYLLYGISVRIRNLLYASGIFRKRRLSVPVVSIGNVTAGGTGKTPCTIAVTRALLADGHRPISILSRGYGRNNPGDMLHVNSLETDRFGDEPVLMFSKLSAEVSVWVGGNRYRTAQKVLEAGIEPALFLLDDGFQHRKLHRDVDIVLLDCTSPFGGNRLIPFGLLREPIQSIRRADVILLTRSRYSRDLEALKRQVQVLNEHAVLARADMEITGYLDPFSGNTMVPGALEGEPVVVFSGIGNPLAFKADMVTSGADVKRAFAFRDHAVPSPDRLSRIQSVAMESGAKYIVTTEKDWVKLAAEALPKTFPLLVCQSELQIDGLGGIVGLIKEKMQHAEGSDRKN